MTSLKGKKILVGCTGSIAVYKTCSLILYMIKEGAEVKVVMTESAKKFVTELTFSTLTGNSVYGDLWGARYDDGVEHINVGHWADIVLIAPATANVIARISNGIADDFLTTAVLALPEDVKVVIAPAMNINMWKNIFVKQNIQKLKNSGKYFIVDPDSGILACRDEGLGKMADIKKIIDMVVKEIK